ncbi:hypothetical protein AB0O01_05835 [Streptomyces sp. NPDC093252]|uniref:hypothetical protein n=1 Tax=Streptomyces sp. NPDC093252 TaxID=3154980 RepID=UPI00341A30B1
MSRGEEFDEPITGDDHFAVVISGDGSAAIDGAPVPIVAGQEPDAAVLDALHDRALVRGTVVTATISDPSAAYVAHIEVSPDGSSRLLEQREGGEGAEGAEEDGDEDGHLVTKDADDGVPPGWTKGEEADADADADEAEDGEAAYTLPEPPPLTGEPPAGDEGDDEGGDWDGHRYDDRPDDRENQYDDDDDGDGGDRAPASEREPAPTPASPSPLHRTLPPALVRRLDRKERARQSDDEYTPSGLLQRPLVVAPAALAVAGIVVVSLVIVGSGGSGDDSAQASARSGTEVSGSPSAERDVPAPTFSVSVSPPSPSASPSPKAWESGEASGSAKPGGKQAPPPPVTVTATAPRSVETVTQKPAVDTAASAVKRLAKSDPDGRHICYRAFVSGQGWQKPVCDGTLAGTTGQNKAIKALNIAVYGVSGSAANAFLHNPDSTNGEGRWSPNWTAVTGDSRDIYVGKTSGPYMTGFAVNVGSGRICPSAKVRGYDWGSQGCADPRPDFVFGGTLENTRFLEAVKFTV